jgi:tight adherence protein B
VSASQAVAVAGALLTMLGVAVAVAGWRGSAIRSRASVWRPRTVGRASALALTGVVTWAVTGWPVAGLAVAVAAVGLPAVLAADRREQQRIARVEAVEEWARRVADVLAIGVGLEQALQSAARTAPPAIELGVVTLSTRIAARMPTEAALRRFADDLADPAADLVVAALILATRRRGPGVAAALSALAGSVAEEVAARRRVEADRAKPRATARAVTVITLVILVLGLLNGGYTAPYATPVGQLVLALTLGFFGTALWWMHSMTVSTPPERLLGGPDEAVRP